MFTGIIEGKCRIVRADGSQHSVSLGIDIGKLAAGVQTGDSIAFNGVCLTVKSIESCNVYLDAVGETLDRTTVKFWKSGMLVNAERAVAVGGRLGGHIVQGHIDCLGEVGSIQQQGNNRRISLRVPVDIAAEIVKKGSVAIDGAGLTVVDVNDNSFEVMLIPHTLAMTTLADLKPGSKVNIETDIIGKYVKKYINQIMLSTGKESNQQESDIDEEKLKQYGFM